MQRGKYYFYVCFTAEGRIFRNGFELFLISLVHFLPDHRDEPLLQQSFFFSHLYQQLIFNFIDFFYDDVCAFRRQLCAILAVYLIAIIFRRVMACGDHNTGKCLQIADRKG
ncbi:Uncharacterised protein [Mycobacteroides abscessus subsp. abscessus]|nr:Uncharacterised protein [Mycobacteroides abscessus subsp. abscessus]